MSSPFVGFMATILAGGGIGQAVMFISNAEGADRWTDVTFGSIEMATALCLYFIIAYKYWVPVFREYHAKRKTTKEGRIENSA